MPEAPEDKAAVTIRVNTYTKVGFRVLGGVLGMTQEEMFSLWVERAINDRGLRSVVKEAVANETGGTS